MLTLTAGTVDYLPVTEELTAFGDLPTQRRLDRKARTAEEQAERLEQAYQTLRARQEKVTGETLRQVAQVRKQVAVDWLRARRTMQEDSSQTGI